MLYTSATMGLALLESLVHAPAGAQPRHLVLITLKLPARSVRSLSARKLPKDWNSLTIPLSTQQIGDDFLHAGEHLALKVPSVILPGDHNLIVNPTHRSAALIEIISIIDLPVDPRLIK
jgi:RES domain-containing protein